MTRIVILACLLAIACSESEVSSSALQVAAPNAEPAEPSIPGVTVRAADWPKVAFLGDSIAAGQFLAEQQAFPSVIERRLKSFALINASVSGDTTADGLRRVDWLLKQKPKIVVVELGEHDKAEGVPATTVEANLRAILSRLKAADTQALLLGVSSEPDRATGAAYARQLAALYPRVAAELSVPFVPFMQGVAGRRELMLPDGVHPTPEGHERIASNLLEPLKALLAE